MRARRTLGIVSAALGSVVFVAAVRAEPPCMADVQKFCHDVPMGAGRVQGCLKEHEADLSATCKEHVDDVGRNARALVAACRYDVMRFCSDVSPGGGRIVRCLQAKQSELSPECKDRIAKASKH